MKWFKHPCGQGQLSVRLASLIEARGQVAHGQYWSVVEAIVAAAESVGGSGVGLTLSVKRWAGILRVKPKNVLRTLEAIEDFELWDVPKLEIRARSCVGLEDDVTVILPNSLNLLSDRAGPSRARVPLQDREIERREGIQILSLDEVVDRLWCPREGLQILCEACHSVKSKRENFQRRERKKQKPRK